MNWFFFIVILLVLFDIKDKLNKLLKRDNKNNSNLQINLAQYKNKNVTITINNDDVEDAYLFSTFSNTVGKIIEYDKEWFIFSYYNKNNNTTTEQYLRIKDIESIDEVQNN